MLDGTLRRGSGMIGSGTMVVAAVVSGALACASAADGAPGRAFGAGLGTGSVCAELVPASDAAISTARAAWKMARCLEIRFKVSSCRSAFYPASAAVGYRFCVTEMAQFRTGLPLPRPESRVFRHDWPVRR